MKEGEKLNVTLQDLIQAKMVHESNITDGSIIKDLINDHDTSAMVEGQNIIGMKIIYWTGNYITTKTEQR